MHPADQLLNALVRLFQETLTQAVPLSLEVATQVGAALLLLAVLVDLARHALTQDPQALGRALYKLSVSLFFYSLLFVARAWVPLFPEAAGELGRRLSGVAGFNPGSILGQGVNLSLTFYNSLGEWVGGLFNPGAAAIRALAAWLVLLAFTVLAVQMARALIEIAILVGPMLFFLGFSTSSFTFPLFLNWLASLLELSVRYLVLFLIVGVAQDLGSTWDEALSSFSAAQDLRLHLVILASAVALAILAWVTPNQLAARLTAGFATGANPLRTV